MCRHVQRQSHAIHWQAWYLQNRSQYVIINGFNSSFEQIHCGVPQGSRWHKSLKLQQFSEKNKQVNQDLKNLSNCLNTNNIYLNISKTEVVLFKPAGRETDVPLKQKLNGKKLHPTKTVKYVGLKLIKTLIGNNRLVI